MKIILIKRIKRNFRMIVQNLMSGFNLIIINIFSLVGLIIFCLIIGWQLRTDLHDSVESYIFDWLQTRQFNAEGIIGDMNAAGRATAVNPQDLNKQQGIIVAWVSKKYRVAPEPISALVQAAYELSPEHQIDPILVIAVMAIESNFHPYVQSEYGAQGLMQVVTKIHTARYKDYGGNLAAFDPLTNMKVGILVLRDCIKLKGSLEEGLRFYVGGTSENDGGYVQKVFTEYRQLQSVANGEKVPIFGDSRSLNDKVK